MTEELEPVQEAPPAPVETDSDRNFRQLREQKQATERELSEVRKAMERDRLEREEDRRMMRQLQEAALRQPAQREEPDEFEQMQDDDIITKAEFKASWNNQMLSLYDGLQSKHESASQVDCSIM